MRESLHDSNHMPLNHLEARDVNQAAQHGLDLSARGATTRARALQGRRRRWRAHTATRAVAAKTGEGIAVAVAKHVCELPTRAGLAPAAHTHARNTLNTLWGHGEIA